MRAALKRLVVALLLAGVASLASAQEPEVAPEIQVDEPVKAEPAAERETAEPRAAEPGPAEPGLTDPEIFLRANQAYDEGDYGRGLALYRELVDRGRDDGRLLYNLGNAYLRDGQLGQAVAAYRRSLARRPRDQDVRANLAFARRSARDALAPPSPSPWVSTLFFWHFQMSRRELAWAVVGINLLVWTLLALWLFKRRSELLPWLLGGSLLVLLALGGSLLVHTLWPQRVAVVLPAEIDARSGPGADAVVRFKLHAGTELEVENVSQRWVRIVGPESQQAWVEADQVEIVRW